MSRLSGLKEVRQGTLHIPAEMISGRGKCKYKGPVVEPWVEASKTRISRMHVLGEKRARIRLIPDELEVTARCWMVQGLVSHRGLGFFFFFLRMVASHWKISSRAKSALMANA